MKPQADESQDSDEEKDFEDRGQSQQDIEDLLADRLPSELDPPSKSRGPSTAKYGSATS